MNNIIFINRSLGDTKFIGVVLGFQLEALRPCRFQWASPGIRLGDSKLIDQSALKLASDVRIFFPISDEAQRDKMLIGFGSQSRLKWMQTDRIWVDQFLVTRFNLLLQDRSGRSIYIFSRTAILFGSSEQIFTPAFGFHVQMLKDNSRPFRVDPLRVGPGGFLRTGSLELEGYVMSNLTNVSDVSGLILLRLKF